MHAAAAPMPPSAPDAFDAGWLDVGHGHRLRYEQAGSPAGIPALLLHGGPGSGSTPAQRRMLDGTRYRIVQFDQRGAGQSTPSGETAHNHTGALIEDIEALRRHLGIERWLVGGGSWGAALALAYAAAHRERVSGVILRGTFLAGREDIDWFFHGVGAYAPEARDEFLRAIPQRWHRSVETWLDRCFARRDARSASIAAAWQTYELRLDGASSAPGIPAPDSDAMQRLVAKYRIQSHYLARRCFLGDAAVIRAANALGGVPLAIVHGERDLICRPSNAWRVHRACRGSRLAWAKDAAHHPFHAATLALLQSAAACFAERGDFSAWPALR